MPNMLCLSRKLSKLTMSESTRKLSPKREFRKPEEQWVMVVPDTTSEAEQDFSPDERLWMSCKQLENPKALQQPPMCGKEHPRYRASSPFFDDSDTHSISPSSISASSENDEEEDDYGFDSPKSTAGEIWEPTSWSTGHLPAPQDEDTAYYQPETIIDAPKKTEARILSANFWAGFASPDRVQASYDDSEIDFPDYGDGGVVVAVNQVQEKEIEPQKFYHYAAR
ncbi:hypothetical protein QBC35DRAFT_505108 [Podospora australis]|uniref:Uncharacterized protein n=1 Tax=Podospora australis TaxID=1536484 RepID=A0AAN6WP02_9PEZI|nr:hypothetical protein QBC35DRAFT_505108 [Podospora australis]